jgi:hypothetical protein
MIRTEDIEDALDGLFYLNQLLPQNPMYSILPPDMIPLKGEVLSRDCLHEGINNGRRWLKSGSLEASLALLLCDGRYRNSVAIMRPSYCSAIAAAHEKHVRFINLKVGSNSFTTEEQIKNLTDDFNLSLNMVIDSIIRPYPDLFKKKLIVFPNSERNLHWTATYVFNPCQIMANDDDGLKTCFYRYCGLNQKGRSSVANSHGVIWFLNVLYSHHLHMNQAGEGAPFVIQYPS